MLPLVLVLDEVKADPMELMIAVKAGLVAVKVLLMATERKQNFQRNIWHVPDQD